MRYDVIAGSVPCTSVGEENCLMLADDKFSTESVLVHEFGHCVMNCGFDAEQMTLVKSLYSAALAVLNLLALLVQNYKY